MVTSARSKQLLVRVLWVLPILSYSLALLLQFVLEYVLWAIYAPHFIHESLRCFLCMRCALCTFPVSLSCALISQPPLLTILIRVPSACVLF